MFLSTAWRIVAIPSRSAEKISRNHSLNLPASAHLPIVGDANKLIVGHAKQQIELCAAQHQQRWGDMISKLTKLLGAAAAVALTAWAGQALAVEGNTPFLSGVSVGTPSGALPPPGFYFSDDNVLINGGLHSPGSTAAPANVSVYLNIPSVLWAPGWSFLGGTYALALSQPFAQQNLDLAGAGLGKTISTGAFNTIFSPVNLGWDFKPFFLKAGLSIYADDGYNQTVLATSGKAPGRAAFNQAGPASIADNYWTFEPDLALSFLQNGWDLTAHAVFDFNTENTDTHYQSGNLFYLDLTAAKNIGKWVVGAGGNFTQQMNCDSGSGNVNGCNELQRVMLGPLVGYNFGPVEIDAKALFSVHTENGFNTNYYYTTFSFPF
jgi:hypothetical protein